MLTTTVWLLWSSWWSFYLPWGRYFIFASLSTQFVYILNCKFLLVLFKFFFMCGCSIQYRCGKLCSIHSSDCFWVSGGLFYLSWCCFFIFAYLSTQSIYKPNWKFLLVLFKFFFRLGSLIQYSCGKLCLPPLCDFFEVRGGHFTSHWCS